MKIVQAHKFFFIKGGADQYFFDIADLLQKAGHEVAFFAMEHSRNADTPWNKYFSSNLDAEQVKYNWSGLKAAVRMFWNCQARRQFRRLLDDFQPDIVHLHSIGTHLSPSIIAECRKQQVPVVMTVHDYSLIAPHYSLFAHGKIDESTKKFRFDQAIRRRLVKNSFSASLLAAAVMAFHKLLKIYDRGISRYLAPSQFMRDKLMEYGIPGAKIEVLPNFTPLNTIVDQQSDEKKLAAPCFVYVGRLSTEKGIDVLCQAASETGFQVKIIGEGEAFSDKWQKFSNIEFLGYKTRAEIAEILKTARALIVPSIWYENCPLTILEAYAARLPVIASEIGGIPELVRNGETGITFTPGNVSGLKKAMTRLATDQELGRKMGERAYALVCAEYNGLTHYEKLLDIYKHFAK